MSTYLTPYEFAATQTLSRKLFRKKMLPVSSIDYNGKTIEFSKEYLQTMVDAFNDGAFDNVPLQFADAKNTHTNDPERYRGDVVAMDLSDDGVYITVAATDKGAEVLSENPKLGISARIVNEYQRSDGKFYPAAVQHALATHDPRIAGLGAWESVDSYSNNGESDIMDFTGESYKKETTVPDFTKEETDALRALLAKADETDASAEDAELTDAELEALMAAVEADLASGEDSDDANEDVTDEADTAVDAKDETKVPVGAGAELSNQHGDANVELSNQLKAQATELSRVRTELDDQRWKRESEMFTREYGLPPALVNLAKPSLKGDGHVTELSNGETVDHGAIMREVLTEFGKLAKMLDLSVEMGSSVEGSNEDADTAATRNEATKAIRSQLSL